MISDQRQMDVLNWYESEERFLSPAYIASIPWNEIKNHPIAPELIATLYYMRDVEKLTEVYYNEAARTPTGKNLPVKRFMDRWRVEESLHGDLLNRFLEEAGQPTSPDWFDRVRAKIPSRYEFESKYVVPLATVWFGKDFSTVHMTWGAINEYSTMNGYSRMRALAKHPVLDKLLDGIMREEARHAQFYWRVANIMLEDSPYRQKLARFFIDRFWTPVGEGTKPKADARMVIQTLFKGEEGVKFFDGRVSAIIRKLPGFSDCATITNTIASAAIQPQRLA